MNVDAAVNGCLGEAAIGGVLRDDKTTILLLFSPSMGVTDANSAELMALSKCFQIVTTSRWAFSHCIIFESDSQNAISWVLNPLKAPLEASKYINEN